MSQTAEFEVPFEVPAKVIYDALLDPFELSKFTRTQAKMEPQVGGEFVLYGGKIQGKNLDLVKEKKIVWNWKFDDWKTFSIVTIVFDSNEAQIQQDGCVLKIKQTDIPKEQNIDKLIDGWKSHIFKPMSQLCGFPLGDGY